MKFLAQDESMKVFSSFPAKCRIEKLVWNSQIQCREIQLQYKDKPTEPDPGFRVEFSFPAVDISGRWFPVCGFDRSAKAEYDARVESMTARSAPVVCFYNGKGENRYTLALSEVRQKVTMTCGVHEEDGNVTCRIEIPLPKKSSEGSYSVKIWESRACEPFWKTLNQVRQWWEETLPLAHLPVPEAGRLPMYSFWYSKHQEITAENVEEECALAAQMGLSTVIVDDGWQTEDNHRGYAYCGDWQPCKEKFPDFAAHVQRVHDMGLKYMLWFSVPYVGRKAKVWEQFQDKLLRYDEGQQAGILDLRYPEVRTYLKEIYEHAIRSWKLDGLKLDFIDEFYFTEESPAYQEGMDYEDIQDALHALLEEVIQALRKIRPDILIEFRQRYIGPQIRRYGNLFRVSDCPCSAISNRLGTVDLRLLSGSTAVHSDMLMWHPKEKPEEAALQMISCLFSTVQISVNLEEISQEMKEMLDFWLSFMKNHVNLLQETQIEPSQPENLYPQVQVQTENSKVLVHYSQGRIVDLRNMPETLYYVNGTKAQEVCFCKEKEGKLAYQVLDCRGRKVEEGSFEESQWQEIWVPTGGMVVIHR